MSEHMTNHGHATIAEAGACDDCRPKTIAAVRELYGDPGMSDHFNDYLLRFRDKGKDLGMAIVPAPDFDVAVENTWATGCNPGGMVGGAVIVRGLADRAGVPTCVLLTGPAALAASDALGAAHKEMSP
jgi:hypothetical protein